MNLKITYHDIQFDVEFDHTDEEIESWDIPGEPESISNILVLHHGDDFTDLLNLREIEEVIFEKLNEDRE